MHVNNMVKRSALDEKHASTILRELLEQDAPIYLSSLQKMVKNYYALYNTVMKLADEGYIDIKETTYRGRSAKLISLTEKGRAVAEKLAEVEDIISSSHGNMRISCHMPNMLNDYISITDENGTADIYFLKGYDNTLYLWCDRDKDFMCEHIEYLFNTKEGKKLIDEFATKFNLNIHGDYLPRKDNTLSKIKEGLGKIVKSVKMDDKLEDLDKYGILEPSSYNIYLSKEIDTVLKLFEVNKLKEAKRDVFKISYLLGRHPEALIIGETEKDLEKLWNVANDRLDREDISLLYFGKILVDRMLYLRERNTEIRNNYGKRLSNLALAAYELYLAWWEKDKRKEIYGM